MGLRVFLITIVLALAACTNHQVRPYGAAAIPTDPGSVQVLYSPPDREHIKLGSVDVRYYRPGLSDPTVHQATPRIQQAGAELGADAVIDIT